MTERAVQRFLHGLRNPGDERVLVEGSEHPYQCRCPTCLAWWATMGPEDNHSWGPFSEREIREYVASNANGQVSAAAGDDRRE